MEIPKQSKYENDVRFSSRLVKSQLPSGAHQHWQRIRCPHPKPKKADRDEGGSIQRHISADGDHFIAKGDPEKVVFLANLMIEMAVKAGDEETAKGVLAAVEDFFLR